MCIGTVRARPTLTHTHTSDTSQLMLMMMMKKKKYTALFDNVHTSLLWPLVIIALHCSILTQLSHWFIVSLFVVSTLLSPYVAFFLVMLAEESIQF
jgi:hypothetical protein